MRRDITQLESQRFDVAIVGGGIHGAWIAMRAAQAGMRVALVERADFGAATSANSLKILHGGLRYLQHLDFARMRSSLRSRREYMRQSPELVKPLPCVMPLRLTGMRSPWVLAPALVVNDVISADRNCGVSTPVKLPRGRLLSARRCEQYVGPLSDRPAAAGALWWDALATDTARLVLEPLAAAAQSGAVIANNVEAQAYLLRASSMAGLGATDRLTGRQLNIRATVVVDAAGPWAGRWACNQPAPAGYLPAAWLGGFNVVLRRSLGIDVAVALTSPAEPSTRELFFVPWSGVTMVGTQYHAVADLRTATGPPPGAVQGFVDEIAAVAPRANVTMADVVHVHWGLLPADAPDAALPSKSPVLAAGRHATGLQGLIVVVGEKLTSAPMLSLAAMKQVRRALRQAAQSTD